MDRFFRYVRVHTKSEPNQNEIPSTARQFDLGNMLVDELKELGITDAAISDHCVVTGTVPSNLPAEDDEKVPVVCFLAHLDTSPDELGENVNPQVITYEGGDIVLPKDKDVVIRASENPILAGLVGQRIVTTDGTTLLGADDKAGIAEIMTAIAMLMKSPERRRGTIKVVFTPDEEIGKGVDAVDVEAIGAKYAYTVDGGEAGQLETQTFNGASGDLIIKGYNTHPGYAKGKMVNSIRVLAHALKLFPDQESPENTEGFEGYSHPISVLSTVNETHVAFIVRDFDYDGLLSKMKRLEEGVAGLREKYPRAEFKLKMDERYYNMGQVLDKHPAAIEIAEEAINRTGLVAKRTAIRGGTDGARLSFMGLPTPNIFAGGLNFHSKKEFVPVEAMEKATEAILNIVDIFVERHLVA